ncbi:MAG: mechanosensitive ion channel [Gammaproteobacteria bacterium]|nr:mechanosensitive ion channel [Gammaproteobacteria bacterium]
MNNKFYRWSVIATILCVVLFNIAVFAFDNGDHQSTLAISDRQLNIDKESNLLVRKQYWDLKNARDRQYQLLREKGVSSTIIKHAQLDYIAAKAAVEGANIALTDAVESADDTSTSIRNLEKNLQSLILVTKSNEEGKIISVEANLEFQKRLQQIQNDRITTLNQIKAVTQQRLKLEDLWQQKLQVLYTLQKQDQQRNHLSEVLSGLQRQQQNWLIRMRGLTQELQVLTAQGEVNDTNLKKLHLQILEAEENVALIRLKSYLVHVQNRIENLDQMNKMQKPSTQLSELVEQSSNTLEQLNSTEEFIRGKIHFLTMKKNELTADLNKQILSAEDAYSYSRMLTNLSDEYNKEINNIDSLVKKAAYYQKDFKLQLQHHLSERHKFPSEWAGWLTLGQRMLQIPYLLSNASTNFAEQTYSQWQEGKNNFFNFALLLLPFIFGAWFYLRRFLLNVEINIKEDKQRFSTNIAYIVVELVRRNLGSMFFLGILIALTMNLNASSFLFIYLFLVFLCFKIFLSIAKLTLLENVNDISGKDVKLYYRIKWSLILGLMLSTLSVVAHNMPVAYEAKTLVNRLFMAFILIIAWQLYKARAVIPSMLESIIHIPRRYFYRVLQVLGILIPLALVFNAVIGLLGYVELAWAVAKYQVIFILVLAGYLVVRGLLTDGMELISELFIRYVKQGWLWTEAILKPLDRIFRIVLFILSCIFLLRLFNLDNNEFFINTVDQLLRKKLFSIGGNSINPLMLCELLIIISLIKWLAHWSREFSYRWLYVNAKDVGVRNSLSIFTQYASVIVSVIIGLKLLGLDLRGFTVVAAAFAAGIGFGMRDLIVNFFSGILLLIERPFRTGDIITLGSYEGEVIITGMRSMTIRTWDHMEVIVPNADMFTKPFVNWTHHDNIVRTVITLKIHREDDPHRVQKLIMNLLRQHASVAKEPSSEVIMSELSDALIEMQVRYYVLLTPQRTRTGVRSEVLFAIWDCFKENNIRSPNPQYDLIVKNQHNDVFEGSVAEFSL